MKQIEIFGCTGAGKTTFAKTATECLNKPDSPLLLSDQYLLQKTKCNWIRNKHLQTIILDSYLLFIFLTAIYSHRNFVKFSLQCILKQHIPIVEKVNIIRNVFKRIGAYETIRRSVSSDQTVLVDGGTIQIAHHLFVHVSTPVCKDSLSRFMTHVPLPEAAIYFSDDVSNLVHRTIERGHKRIPCQSPEHTNTFIYNAVQAFDEIINLLENHGRMTPFDSQYKIFVLLPCLDEINLKTKLRHIINLFENANYS